VKLRARARARVTLAASFCFSSASTIPSWKVKWRVVLAVSPSAETHL
jgi:hypothetical protein